MNDDVKLNTWPEGWNEVIKTLTFLPDDKSRNEFLAAMVVFLAQM
ncbi:hypothetical protein OXPF_25510 [Oxobacter pfennigii]|uniref:Uncharacterized protein n=1 Tax=Oxobacter pfennigii TaxID=36849 RepID=A0A0P8YA74_9CLOT|nr:hypothetical protein [Oxobacter pfennigii]KPU43846.1 hypothetical protein OXPF_25510 [Oxobacter pfennigii]